MVRSVGEMASIQCPLVESFDTQAEMLWTKDGHLLPHITKGMIVKHFVSRLDRNNFLQSVSIFPTRSCQTAAYMPAESWKTAQLASAMSILQWQQVWTSNFTSYIHNAEERVWANWLGGQSRFVRFFAGWLTVVSGSLHIGLLVILLLFEFVCRTVMNLHTEGSRNRPACRTGTRRHSCVDLWLG